MFNNRTMAILAVVLGAAALRIVPHAPNFSPIGAMALFSGAHLSRRGASFIAPLLALLLSDAVLGFYGHMEVVYGSTALVVFLGWMLATNRSALRIAGFSLAGSTLFFLITNFGVWAYDALYPKTIAGLIACYTTAIPFFQNGLIGDLFYAGVFFGGFALSERLIPTLREPAQAG
jgi:hypothetical protein